MKLINKNYNKSTISLWGIIILVIVLIGLYYFIPQIKTFGNTFSVLRDSSFFWLFIGLIATILSFVSAAITQFIAGYYIGTVSNILLIQMAGSFINHFLPFNLGNINLITKYYVKHQKSQSKAIIAATLPTIFGVITTVFLVIVISPITLVDYFSKFQRINFTILQVSFILFIFVIVVVLGMVFRLKLKKFIFESIKVLKNIKFSKQVIFLVLGSLAITLTSSAVLYSSIRSIGLSVSIVSIFVLYTTSSLIGNISPTPGGVGAIEAFLVFGLVAMRLNLSQAVAVTLIFRFLTFWLPILPEALAFHRVNKRKMT